MSDTIMFTRGVPPAEAFPTEEIADSISAALAADPAVVLQYGQQPGYPKLRRLLASEYGVSENEVMVGNGSLHLQDLLAGLLIQQPGQLVLVEQPSYDRAITTFRRRGGRVVGIPLHEDGIDIERLEAQLQREVPAFMYLVPDFQNPTGATMSLEKRQQVVALAEQYNFLLIEDVPYRKLRYAGENPPMLRDIDPTHVVTMSSYSKLLSPGMRVGFMLASASLVKQVTALAEETYLAPVLPTQAGVATYIERGWMDENISRLKELYTPRWRTMVDAVKRELPQAQAFLPDGGFFVSVMLPESANTANLVERAKAIGLVLTPGQAFFADSDDGTTPDGERFVRLPFCAVTPAQIDEGVKRLASLL